MGTAITPWQFLLAVGPENPVPNLDGPFANPMHFFKRMAWILLRNY